MRVTIRLLPRNGKEEPIDLPDGATVEDAIRSRGLFPDGWIAVLGDEPVPLDEGLKEGDSLKLISVVSGG